MWTSCKVTELANIIVAHGGKIYIYIYTLPEQIKVILIKVIKEQVILESIVCSMEGYAGRIIKNY